MAKIVYRLTEQYNLLHSKSVESLERKYLVHEDRHPMTEEAMVENVQKFYYEKRGWKKQQQQQLEQKWIPQEEPNHVSADFVKEIVTRLAVVPPKKVPNETPFRKIASVAEHEIVERLYVKRQEESKQIRAQLKKKYLWEAEISLKSADDIKVVVERLATPHKNVRAPLRKAGNSYGKTLRGTFS